MTQEPDGDASLPPGVPVVDRTDVMAVLRQVDSGEIGLELVDDDAFYPVVRTTTGWYFKVFTDDAPPSSGFDYIEAFKRPGSEKWLYSGGPETRGPLLTQEPVLTYDPLLWYRPKDPRVWVSVWAPTGRDQR